MTSQQIAAYVFCALSGLFCLALVVYELYEFFWMARDDIRWKRHEAIESIHRKYAKANVGYAGLPETLPCVDCPWPDWGCCGKLGQK